MVDDWLFCAATGLAIPCFEQVRGRWLNWPCKHIARYSYGIYLWHVPILWLCFVRIHTGSAVVSSALAILLTGCVSVVLYHVLEAPGIRLGKRIAGRVSA